MRSLFLLRKTHDFSVSKLKSGMTRKYVTIHPWDGGNAISSNKDTRSIKALTPFSFNLSRYADLQTWGDMCFPWGHQYIHKNQWQTSLLHWWWKWGQGQGSLWLSCQCWRTCLFLSRPKALFHKSLHQQAVKKYMLHHQQF